MIHRLWHYFTDPIKMRDRGQWWKRIHLTKEQQDAIDNTPAYGHQLFSGSGDTFAAEPQKEDRNGSEIH